MRFRRAFYNVHSEIIRLVDADEARDWLVRYEMEYTQNDINLLSRFVQYFNISREEFDAAMKLTRLRGESAGFDRTVEAHELPNADIIFTFDNDIIRYFYRRE